MKATGMQFMMQCSSITKLCHTQKIHSLTHKKCSYSKRQNGNMISPFHDKLAVFLFIFLLSMTPCYAVLKLKAKILKSLPYWKPIYLWLMNYLSWLHTAEVRFINKSVCRFHFQASQCSQSHAVLGHVNIQLTSRQESTEHWWHISIYQHIAKNN